MFKCGRDQSSEGVLRSGDGVVHSRQFQVRLPHRNDQIAGADSVVAATATHLETCHLRHNLCGFLQVAMYENYMIYAHVHRDPFPLS